MIRKGGVRPFDWWMEVRAGDRISVVFDGGGHDNFSAVSPFAGALGVWIAPGPKDWSPALRTWEFHAVGDVPVGKRMQFRIRRADERGVLTPFTQWEKARPLFGGTLGVLRTGSPVLFSGEIRSSIP